MGEMRKILVTGGSGFIGSNFIRSALSNNPDWSILNLDALTYAGNSENLKDVERDYPGRYRFAKADCCDEKAVDNAMKDTDMVFHFAAESHVDVSIRDPFIFTRSNVLGTHVMLESARKNDVPRFVFISTDEVYGSIRDGSFTEESHFRPNSPYSSSKAGADLLARSYYMTYGLPVVITRSSNNFGPYQYPEKLIPLFITNLMQGKKVPLYGNGENVRDWIYVKDNCEGIEFAANRGADGEAYNIGGGNEKSNIEITRTILKKMEKDDSMIEFVEDRPGHDFRYSLDTSRMQKIGWKPRFGFDSALVETIEWYKNNTAWWKPLKDSLLKKGQVK
ncbi:dTDP-glucose 4,6-dehydratase [Candidatus Woesearchaeota archaeon]|nr:dTDP-glucose 4,6-dehydratase [Candidatus Woesearchaeota archaeon]